MDYFAGCKTAKERKDKFRELCKKLHPDVGGNAAEFAAMITEFEKTRKEFKFDGVSPGTSDKFKRAQSAWNAAYDEHMRQQKQQTNSRFDHRPDEEGCYEINELKTLNQNLRNALTKCQMELRNVYLKSSGLEFEIRGLNSVIDHLRKELNTKNNLAIQSIKKTLAKARKELRELKKKVKANDSNTL